MSKSKLSPERMGEIAVRYVKYRFRNMINLVDAAREIDRGAKIMDVGRDEFAEFTETLLHQTVEEAFSKNPDKESVHGRMDRKRMGQIAILFVKLRLRNHIRPVDIQAEVVRFANYSRTDIKDVFVFLETLIRETIDETFADIVTDFEQGK